MSNSAPGGYFLLREKGGETIFPLLGPPEATDLYEGPEGGLPIPFSSHNFFPNPTNQCHNPTDVLTKHQSHSHFGFFFWLKSQSQRPKSHFPSAKTGKSQFPFYPFRTLWHTPSPVPPPPPLSLPEATDVNYVYFIALLKIITAYILFRSFNVKESKRKKWLQL